MYQKLFFSLMIGVIIAGCVFGQEDTKPRIVTRFACSDYCPGPKKQYMVKVYEGVEDKEECEKLGGKHVTYYGWGKFDICIAE
jgi:hypothetical protein